MPRPKLQPCCCVPSQRGDGPGRDRLAAETEDATPAPRGHGNCRAHAVGLSGGQAGRTGLGLEGSGSCGLGEPVALVFSVVGGGPGLMWFELHVGAAGGVGFRTSLPRCRAEAGEEVRVESCQRSNDKQTLYDTCSDFSASSLNYLGLIHITPLILATHYGSLSLIKHRVIGYYLIQFEVSFLDVHMFASS